MPVISSWTTDKVNDLVRLWGEGHSAAQIGAMIGFTRNAVCGKLHRLRAPEPLIKKVVVKNRVYACQNPDREKARIREARYRLKRKEQVRAQFRANGTSPYSAAYRKHFPEMPAMSKSALRAMLATAMQNTAAL